MATKKTLASSAKAITITDKRPIKNFGSIKGGYIDFVDDVLQDYKGSVNPTTGAVKAQGMSLISENSDALAFSKGGFIWKNKDTTATVKSHYIWAANNEINVTIDGITTLLRDVEDDSYEIAELRGSQYKNTAYLCIGDKTQTAKLYKYIGHLERNIVTIDDNGGNAQIKSVGHGLSVGMDVTIDGTAGYDGTYEILSLETSGGLDEPDMFTVDKVYGSGESVGTIEVNSGFTEAPMTGMNAGSNIAVWDGSLAVTGIGSYQSSPQYSEYNNAGSYNDFTLGTSTIDGGNFNGDFGGVTAMVTMEKYLLVFQDGKIIPQKRAPAQIVNDLYVKDPDTLQDQLSVTGYGTKSRNGAIVARGKIYYVDPNNGIFEYSIGLTRSGHPYNNKELTKNWKEWFLRYDTDNCSIEYYPPKDLLLIACSSSVGGANDTILIYSFKTGGWSEDPGKYISLLMYDQANKKLIGLGSIVPAVYEIYDGTYNNLGEDIELDVWTRVLEGGDRGEEKDHERSSFVMGLTSLTKEVRFRVYGDESPTPDIDETIDVEDLQEAELAVGAGNWGQYIMGSGGGEINRTAFGFKQHVNMDSIDEFGRISERVTEKSSSPFVVLSPVVEITRSNDLREDT